MRMYRLKTRRAVHELAGALDTEPIIVCEGCGKVLLVGDEFEYQETRPFNAADLDAKGCDCR